MNESSMTAWLSWLFNDAQNGELPEHIDESERSAIERFLSLAIDYAPEASATAGPLRALVELTHTL